MVISTDEASKSTHKIFVSSKDCFKYSAKTVQVTTEHCNLNQLSDLADNFPLLTMGNIQLILRLLIQPFFPSQDSFVLSQF